MTVIYTGLKSCLIKYIFYKYKYAENKGISTIRVRILFIKAQQNHESVEHIFLLKNHMCTQHRTFVLKSQSTIGIKRRILIIRFFHYNLKKKKKGSEPPHRFCLQVFNIVHTLGSRDHVVRPRVNLKVILMLSHNQGLCRQKASTSINHTRPLS